MSRRERARERLRERHAARAAGAMVPAPKQRAFDTVASLAPLVASYLFGPVGGKTAQVVVDQVKRAMYGNGDYERYKPARNSLVNNNIGEQDEFGIPGAASVDHFRVAESDPLGALTTPAPGTFVCYKYDINPSSPDLFPRLCAIAEITSQNAIHGLVFKFISGYSELSTAGPLPEVAIGWSCDPTLAAPTSWINMQMLEGAIVFKASRSGISGFECADTMTASRWYYNRNSNMDVSRPPQAYYQGSLYIGVNNPTGGPVAGTSLGSMHIAYDVEFKDVIPITRPSGFAHIERSSYTNTAFFGTAAVRPDVTTGQLFNTNINTAGTSITFPELPQGSRVHLTMHWVGTTAVAWNSPAITWTNATVINAFVNNTASWRQSPGNTTSTFEGMLEIVVEATGGANQVVTGTVAAGAILPTGTTTFTLMASVIGNGVVLAQI